MPAHGNALWLVSALEESNLLDGDHFQRAESGVGGSDKIGCTRWSWTRLAACRVMSARCHVRIFERISRRVSDDPREGLALARAFTTVLALSRLGFRERDLATLVPRVATLLDPSARPLTWNGLAFAALRRALRAPSDSPRRGRSLGLSSRAGTVGGGPHVCAEQRCAKADPRDDRRLPARPVRRRFPSRERIDASPAAERRSGARRAVRSGGPSSRACEAATRELSAAIVQQQEGGVWLAAALLAAHGLSDEIVGRLGDRFVRELFDALRSASLAHQEEVARAAHDQLERLCAIDAANAGSASRPLH